MAQARKNITTNSFTQAMRSDRTVYAQDKRSYREAWNGTIVFSGQGDAQFCNELGTSKLTALLPTNYIPIGGGEVGDRLVIFSTNDINSEIGIVNLNPDGTLLSYTRIFNDAFDPNGNLLDFDSNFLVIDPESTRETIDKENIYWTDRNGEPHSLDINVGKQAISAEFTAGDYTPLVSTGKYPWFYSVSQMALQPDFKMGTIKLKDATPIDGSLKTGMYEMFYRMTSRSGYVSPNYPLSRHFFVTLDVDVIAADPLLNMHYRMMYASNVMTDKRYIFTIENVDLRYYKLEVGYVYSTDKDVSVEACIFYSEVINPLTPNVDVDFASTTGIPISFDEFNRYIVPIRRVNSIGQHDNRLWLGGVETYGPFKLDLSGVTIEPYMRPMAVDTKEDTDDLPLTNINTATTNVNIELYRDNTGTDIYSTHTIVGDYANYKGILWEHLFSSYWGGETYPFFLVIFDLKGNPFYAQHIRDYTFPQRYDDPTYNIMTDDNHINLFGLKFSNIDLTDIAFDAGGKLQISGVAITRGKRVPRILCQGIVIPTVIENDVDITELMPSATNDFHPQNPAITDGFEYDDGDYNSNAQIFNSRAYTAQFISPDLLFERNIWEGTSQDDVREEADQLVLVGLYENTYNGEASPLNPGDFNKFYTKHYTSVADTANLLKLGTKTRIRRMLTIETFEQQDTEWEQYDQDDLDLTFKNDANIHTDAGLYDSGCDDNLHAQGVRQSWIIKTKDIKTATYYLASDPEASRYYIANYIVNQDKYYTVTQQKSLADRLSIGTGHFLPITQAVMDAILIPAVYQWTFPGSTFSSTTITITINGTPHTSPAVTSVSALTTWLNTLGLGSFGNASATITVTSAVNTYSNFTVTTPSSVVSVSITGGDRYILNKMEVWGGDCYPWIFDFVRLYPKFSGDCSHSSDCWSDYGLGVIVPLESSMNMALRRGRNFAKVGIRSETDACSVDDTGFGDGISIGQPEEFYLNSVLMHEGNVQMFVSLPEVVDPFITKFNYLWLYSNLKIFGEVTDQYRVFLTGNRGSMDPSFGAIQGRGYMGENMYCLQERGFFRLRINEIKALTTATGEAIGTGVTEVWQKPAPISSLHGCIHPFAIINTDKGLYWPDHYNKCFCRFAQDGVLNISEASDQKQASYDALQYLDTDTLVIDDEIRHIAGGWDPVRNLIYWSMVANYHALPKVNKTIMFAEDDHVNAFVSYFDFVAHYFVNCKSYLLSFNNMDVYIHNKGIYGNYYGLYVDTKIKFICNDMADVNKLWDNSWASLNPSAYICLKQINWVTETQTQTFTLFNHNYLYLSAVTATDPTSGRLKFNNTTLASATLLHISETDNTAVALEALINKWRKIMVYQNADSTKYAIFQVNGIVDNGTWDTLSLTFIEGSSAFVNLDPVTIVVLDTMDYNYDNLMFTLATMHRGATEHLSGKYLSIEYVFTNANNKQISFTSHDESFRPIAKIR